MKPKALHVDLDTSAAVTTTPHWDLGQCVDAWARLGIPAMGVTRAKLEEFGWKKGIKRIKDSGLKVSGFHGIGGLYDAGLPQRFEQNLDIARVALDAAAELGAGCGLVVGGPRGDRSWDQAAQDYIGGINQILPQARERGVRLAIEPIHPFRQQWGFINTLKDAGEMAAAFDDPYVGVVFDFWHHWWERDIEETIRKNVDNIFIVHVSDFKRETIGIRDRAMLGEGIVPIAHLLQTLKDAGYSGYYEIEVISDDLERMDYETAIRRLLDVYQSLKPKP